MFLVAVGRKGCLSVILGQLTRCEKSFVPAKKFVVEREREEIETQDSFSGSIRQKSPTSVRYKRRDWVEQRKGFGKRGKEREITLWKLIKKTQQT